MVFNDLFPFNNEIPSVDIFNIAIFASGKRNKRFHKF